MKKIFLILVYCLCAGLMLASCGQRVEPLPPSSIPSSSIAAPPEVSNADNENDNSVSTTKDLQDAYEKYMRSIFIAGLVTETWDNPEQLDPDKLLMFYYLEHLEKEYPDGWESLNEPSQKVEQFIQCYFDVPKEHLRTASKYRSDSDTYLFGYGLGMATALTVKNIQQQQNDLTFTYDITDALDQKTGQGNLTIEQDEDSYKYVGCQYESISVS